MAVLQDTQDGIAGKSVGGSILLVRAGLPVEQQQTAFLCPHPELSLAIFVQAAHRVADGKRAVTAVFLVDADEGGVVAAPKDAFPVFGERLQILDAIVEELEAILCPVKGIQAAFVGSAGPDPVL